MYIYLYAYVKRERVRRFRRNVRSCFLYATSSGSIVSKTVLGEMRVLFFRVSPSVEQSPAASFRALAASANPVLPANHRGVWIGTRPLLQRVVNEYADGDDAAYIDKNDLRNGVTTRTESVLCQ